MSRFLLLVLAVLAVIVVVGGAVLGTFPPSPRPQAVDHVLPNDKFTPR
jgi:hypothetical protein